MHLAVMTDEDIPWLKFLDEELPDWLPHEDIPYSCRYMKRLATMVLKHQSFEDVYYTLSRYTKKNHHIRTEHRERAITATILFFAEPQRERGAQEFVEGILVFGERALGTLLDKRIHGWAGACRDTFRHEVQPEAKCPHLLRAQTFLGYNTVHVKDGKDTYKYWDIVGKKGDILILKFDEIYALPVIIKRQKKAVEEAALWQPQQKKLDEISSMIEAHISPNSDQTHNWRQLQHCSQFLDFGNYLVFLLVRGEGRYFEIRQAAGLLLKNNLRVAFSSITPSSQEYIKSRVLQCIGQCIGQTNKSI